MDDAFLMGVLNRMANLDEQAQALGCVQVVVVAVIRHPHATHQFHHKVWPARLGRAGIEHAGDVGVIHQGQRLTLGLEAGDNAPGVHSKFDDLNRHAAADRLLLFRHVNHPAASLPDFLPQPVMSDAHPHLLLGGEIRSLRRSNFPGEDNLPDIPGLCPQRSAAAGEKSFGVGMGLKHVFDRRAQAVVVEAGLVKEKLALRRVFHAQGGVEQSVL